jgi:hypothetical protein
MAAAAIGPNIVRTAEFESRTANAYRLEIEKQMKADATPIPDVSEKTREALGAVAAAKNDAKGAEAFKAQSFDPEIARELNTFSKAVEDRFGEEGARAIMRADATGKTFEHASVSKDRHAELAIVTKLYATARAGQRQVTQAVEAERIAARQTEGARLKP